MDNKKKNRFLCGLFGCFLCLGFFLCIFLPKKEDSYSERRKLAQFPAFSLETVLNGKFMSNFETYAQDQFPFRESFRSLKAMTATKVFGRKDNHGIYVTDGYASAMEYPMNEKHMDLASKRFRYIYEKYLDQNQQIYFSIIPDKNYFLAKDSGHLSMDYEEFEKKMSEKVDFATYIKISDLLKKEDYYKTDTHWKQESLIPVATRLANAMGWEFSNDFQEHTLTDDFLGVYAGQSALYLKPEPIRYLTNHVIENSKVFDYQNNKPIKIYDFSRKTGKDPYEFFLSGPLSLITIENQLAKEEKELILFRDSFGSSIAPLLLEGYSKITLVDIRYIQPDLLSKFIDFHHADVLFLYSSLVLNTFSF